MKPSVEDVAAYLLDRADQYDTKSPCWVSLSDAAHALMSGEIQKAIEHGELQEPELRRRVRSFKGKAPKVKPRAGIGKEGPHLFVDASDDPAPAPVCWACGLSREAEVHKRHSTMGRRP